ncbi:hypothetical protein [Microvirga calopogonii]|uniref:hypothetical protein n=1 Tax=Microvirga calopogonii TaxID=2078013 RepID=UPI000E0CC72D|nr:hypothetical protein [Microvirga calopogonii]
MSERGRHTKHISAMVLGAFVLFDTVQLSLAQDGLQLTPLQSVPKLPPSPPSTIKTYTNIAEFLALGLPLINNFGVDMRVSAELKKLEPKILNDLKYAGSGGVLVVARVQSTQTDSGEYRKLIGNRLDYVGIGATPAEAELNHTEHPDPFYVIEKGQVDASASLAYWFRSSPDGSIAVGHQPVDLLTRDMLALYAERNLGNFDWSVARSRELERLMDEFRTRVVEDGVRSEIEKLASSRREALVALDQINAKLNEELERARKSAESIEVLNLLYMGASFASFVQRASEGLSTNDKDAILRQTTREGVLSELDAINKRARANENLLREETRVRSNTSNNIETQAITILRQYKVPVDNLPPSRQPTIRPE